MIVALEVRISRNRRPIMSSRGNASIGLASPWKPVFVKGKDEIKTRRKKSVGGSNG